MNKNIENNKKRQIEEDVMERFKKEFERIPNSVLKMDD